jgi:(S)-2-hydroxy-acid oxidase
MADSGNSADDPITLDEVEAIAKRRLPSNVYDFYSSGADDQVALRRNREAYNE